MLSRQKSYGSKVNEQYVKDLMEMGYSKQEAEEALSICDGNKEHAAQYLLNQSQAQGKSPKR